MVGETSTIRPLGVLRLAKDLDSRTRYRLLIGSVVPRPVAWVSTLGRAGARNLAPFSYFMGLGGDAPYLAVSVNAHRGGEKDTLRNIEETGEFVVNIADEELLEAMVLTSGDHAYGVDEFQIAGVTPEACAIVKPPRVLEAPIAMECRLDQIVRLGEAPRWTAVIFGEILAWHFEDGILTDDGVPDMSRLRPVGRMIDDEYLLTRERRMVPRPRVEKGPPVV